MSKADELRKKMAQAPQASFTPRQSVPVRPIPDTIEAEVLPAKEEPKSTPKQEKPEPVVAQQTKLTIVDTSETPVNRGFHMFPSRHRQVVKDLVYIEDRKPWEIIEDALEEYVVRHYGKEYKRK